MKNGSILGGATAKLPAAMADNIIREKFESLDVGENLNVYGQV